MPPLRIALIGAGWVTEHHLDAYRAIPDRARVVAVADPNEAARTSRARSYDIKQSFTSANDMLDALSNGIDAVDVASPRERHAEHVQLAVSHGLPVLCQKPLAPTLAEAEALVRGLPQGARVMVHENWRFRPHYRLIAQWLADGRIGSVRQAILRILTGGLVASANGTLPALERQPMLRDLERMLLTEVLIHHIDVLRFLLGPLTLHAAQLGRDCPTLKGEDRAALLMGAGESGDLAVTIIGDFMAHGHDAAQIDRLDILGRDGAIALDGSGLRYLRGQHTVEHVNIDFAANYKASYRDAIAHFCENVVSGDPFETAPKDNLQTLRIVERAYEVAGSPAPARAF